MSGTGTEFAWQWCPRIKPLTGTLKYKKRAVSVGWPALLPLRPSLLRHNTALDGLLMLMSPALQQGALDRATARRSTAADCSTVLQRPEAQTRPSSPTKQPASSGGLPFLARKGA